MQKEDLILKELKDIKESQKELVQRVGSLEKGQANLEKGQAALGKDFDDLKTEFKEGLSEVRSEIRDSRVEMKVKLDHAHKFINDGFRNISESLKQLFAHEKRITSLEHNFIRMTVLLPREKAEKLTL